ncbi:MAG: 2-amino-4-hydroxy-6-hydroxymethyldihydropteridine diphosphokinase [Planctomycetes bacterium]|nr:2-amino-4-hydroxy-6-hydroxymethyldihydropteridine diphosphokinase [Planctomycetota bacterium]
MGNGHIYVALGSNQGPRAEHLRSALHELEERGDIRVLRCSSLHETAPVGGPAGQRDYLNAVAELQTALSPRDLLARLQQIEQRHGRRRTVRNGPRTLDLDLLLYDDEVIDEPDLTVPHPRMWTRSFVMEPLREVCEPGWLDGLARATRAGRLRSEYFQLRQEQ